MSNYIITSTEIKQEVETPAKKSENELIVLGIDHGYGNMKTAHCCFPAAVTSYEQEPVFKDNLLVYNGKYYRIGDGHREFTPEKIMNEDYYILTLAAMAQEMMKRKLTCGKVHIAAGLPLTWVTEQKERFRAYLLRKDKVTFTYNGTEFNIEIVGADIYPQGFSAIAPKLKSFKGTNLLVDIGNGTLSAMYINNGKPQDDKKFTEKFGTYQCVMAVREAINAKFGITVEDSTIEEVIRTGTADIADRYLEVIRDAASKYTEGIFRRLREHEYNPELMKLYVVGGGSCMVKHFGNVDESRVTVNTDVCATVKGYEWMTKQRLKRAGVIQ